MITYEGYKSLEEIDLNTGDRVVVVYQDAIDYFKTGVIISMTLAGANRGDCTILMDDTGKTKEYYHSNIRKIVELIEVPSGEVLAVFHRNLMELAGTGLIKWDKKKQIYYYQEQDRWEIERFMI